MNSWYTIRARDTGAEVLIYDEIGAYGVSAKGFLAELGALPEDAAIDLRLNSPGGSVFDAVAIHNALTRHAGSVTAWIDGIAASAASYVAMAGDEIVIPENAFLMIHDPSGLVVGTAADMREMAGTLDKIAAGMMRGYAARSGKPEDEIAALMAAETWFDGAEALEAGLATRMAEPVRIAANFDITRFRNAPPALVEGAAEPSPQWDGASPPNETAEPEAAATGPDIVEGANDVDPTAPGDGALETLAADKSSSPAPAMADPGALPEGAGVAASSVSGPVGIRDASAAPPPDAKAHVPAGNMPPSASGQPQDTTPPDPAAIRAEAMAHARAVTDLCRLAGRPQMAGRFLEEEASLDAVRARLLEARAEATPEISPHHPQPGRGATTRPWGDVIARTFRMKG